MVITRLSSSLLLLRVHCCFSLCVAATNYLSAEQCKTGGRNVHRAAAENSFLLTSMLAVKVNQKSKN